MSLLTKAKKSVVTWGFYCCDLFFSDCEVFDILLSPVGCSQVLAICPYLPQLKHLTSLFLYCCSSQVSNIARSLCQFWKSFIPSSFLEKQTNADPSLFIFILDMFPYFEKFDLILGLLNSSLSSRRVIFRLRLLLQSLMTWPFSLHPKHSGAKLCSLSWFLSSDELGVSLLLPCWSITVDGLSLTLSDVKGISLFAGTSFGFEFTLKFNHSEEIISFVLFLSLFAKSEGDSVAWSWLLSMLSWITFLLSFLSWGLFSSN